MSREQPVGSSGSCRTLKKAWQLVRLTVDSSYSVSRPVPAQLPILDDAVNSETCFGQGQSTAVRFTRLRPVFIFILFLIIFFHVHMNV